MRDSFRAVTRLDDASVVLAGATRGNWAMMNAGGDDFAAVKLDGDGLELWRWQASRGWKFQVAFSIGCRHRTCMGICPCLFNEVSNIYESGTDASHDWLDCLEIMRLLKLPGVSIY